MKPNRATPKWSHVLAVCLFIGCPTGIEAQARKATDVDNGLELGIEIVSGEFRVGGECTIRVWIKNVSKEEIAVPEPPLGVDLLPMPRSQKKELIEWEDYERPDSWRCFYCFSGPFRPDGGGFGIPRPSDKAKAELVEDFDEFCRNYRVDDQKLRIILLSPGDSRERNVTHSLKRPNCGYFDSGMFYDLDKLGVPPEQQRALMKDMKKEIPIWKGALYVFLKIPE